MSTISASTTTTTAFKVTSDTTGTLVLQTGSTPTTAVTIDTSGNLGIGTSSPGYKLQVSGAVYASGDGSSVSYYAAAGGAIRTVGTGALYIDTATTTGTEIIFRPATTERMRLDASGNLSVGTTAAYGGRINVTPSSTATTVAGGNQIQIGESSSNTGYRLQLGYINETTAGFIGSIQSYGGGVANNLVLQGAGGNLGIGTTSPSQKLNVATASGNAYMRVERASQATGQVGLQIGGGTSSTDWFMYVPASSNTLTWFGNSANLMSLDTSGNLGIGTSSPSEKLHIYGANPYLLLQGSEASAQTLYMRESAGGLYFGQYGVGTRMLLDSSGNLGIGTTSPATKLDVVGTVKVTSSSALSQVWNSASGAYTSWQYNGTTNGDIGTGNNAFSGGATGDFGLTSRAGNLVFGTGSTERARIDTSGNLLVGTTTVGMTAGGVRLKNGGGNLGEIALSNNSGATDYVARFLWGSSATLVGNITVSSTATSYVTSSDYRLKSDVQPMAGALARVAALKPVTYKWNIDGSAGEGFIAHELAEVCPYAVAGEKDAMDAEGKPVYQGVDTSFLVATLAAAIQELKAEFDAYKASHP